MSQLDSTVLLGSRASPSDPFSAALPKLAALLDLPSEPRTLLIGAPETTLQSTTEISGGAATNLRTVEDLSPAAPGGRSYDLIIWSYDPTSERQGLESGLKRLRHLLDRDGTVVLHAPNRFDLRRIRRQPMSVLDTGLHSAAGYRTSAIRSGFTTVGRYLPLPDPASAEEYLAEGEAIDLPSNVPMSLRLLSATGALRHLHPGYCFHLSTGTPGIERLLSRLARLLELNGTPGGPRHFRLQRYALRRRGALILTLASDPSGPSMICRITTATEIDRVVRENARWVAEIIAEPGLDQHARDLLPVQFGSLDLDGARAYLEEKRSGIIAWKFARHQRLERSLFAQSIAFLDSLHVATRRTEALTEARLNELLELPAHPWYDDEFTDLLRQLRCRLVQYFLDQRRTLTVSHGDYGYGNLLADPRLERITGVIDWDQARVDLAGVDLLNFMIQRRRMTAQVSLPEAMSAIVREVVNDPGSIGSGALAEIFADSEEVDRKAVFAWSVWRFVERDTRYEPEYARGRTILMKCVADLLQAFSP